MGGYSCMRTSTYSAKEVYGKLHIPTTYAGTCPGDFDGTQIPYNVIPEMFYGYYRTGIGGIDIGIRVGGGGGWRAFCYDGGSGIIPSTATKDSLIFSTSLVTPGILLYMRTWVEKTGTKYYACINVSTSGYNNTDLMSTPLKTEISSSFGAAILSYGATINREISLAANSGVPNYETSGCYMTNAEFIDTGLKMNSGSVIWDDNKSKIRTEPYGATPGASGTNVLLMRKDYATSYNPNRMKLISVTNGLWGATEKVSIDFRATPQI